MKNEIIITGELQLSPVLIKEEYRKKWNITQEDFYHLTKNGQLLNNTLYRKGMFGGKIKHKYFMLLKHVEAFYSDDITKDPKRKPHLESQWVIMDIDGFEKVNFKAFTTPYIIDNSVIYSVNNKIFNIETGYCYGETYHRIESENYIFINNEFAKDEKLRGVIKIDKKSGVWELFK